ncbi:MAG TPA: ABC transporter permease subunit [Vicinamibacterales bacterium]
MPIHDQGYRRYAGIRTAPGRAWSVIAKAGIRAMLSKRLFIGLLLVSWVQFLVRAVLIYLSTTVPQASFLAADARTFRQFLEIQEVFMFLVAVYAGAGLIANDRRAHALQIYLSKPLTRVEYVFGKLGVLMAFLLLVSWVPAIALLLVQIMFSGSFRFVIDNAFLFPAITLFSFIQVATMGMAMLALSSMSNSSRFVGMLYAALNFFSQGIYGFVLAVTRDSGFAWLSMPLNLAQIGDAIFGLPLRYRMPVPVAFLAIGVLIGASVFILERQVRGVEVVA